MTKQEKIAKAQVLLAQIRASGLTVDEVSAVAFAGHMQDIANGYNAENPSDEPEDHATIYSEAQSFVNDEDGVLSTKAWLAFELIYGPEA